MTELSDPAGIPAIRFLKVDPIAKSFSVVIPAGWTIEVPATLTAPVNGVISLPTDGTLNVEDQDTYVMVQVSSTGVDKGLILDTGGVNAITLDTSDGIEIGATDAALVGFYGAEPVAQAAAPILLADVIAILTNLGLCAS